MAEKSEVKRQTSKRPSMRSFEADPDVDQMLNDAEALGKIQKKIINAALRKYGKAAVRAEAKRLREKAGEIEQRNTDGRKG